MNRFLLTFMLGCLAMQDIQTDVLRQKDNGSSGIEGLSGKESDYTLSL